MGWPRVLSDVLDYRRKNVNLLTRMKAYEGDNPIHRYTALNWDTKSGFPGAALHLYLRIAAIERVTYIIIDKIDQNGELKLRSSLTNKNY